MKIWTKFHEWQQWQQKYDRQWGFRYVKRKGTRCISCTYFPDEELVHAQLMKRDNQDEQTWLKRTMINNFDKNIKCFQNINNETEICRHSTRSWQSWRHDKRRRESQVQNTIFTSMLFCQRIGNRYIWQASDQTATTGTAYTAGTVGKSPFGMAQAALVSQAEAGTTSIKTTATSALWKWFIFCLKGASAWVDFPFFVWIRYRCNHNKLLPRLK